MHASRSLRQDWTQADGGGGVGPVVPPVAGNRLMRPSSPRTAPMGLKAIEVPVVSPPQRMPTSVPVVAAAPEPGGIVKTGAPLSPPWEPAEAMDVHRATKLVPLCGISAHVAVTVPPVQPVVLPTLVTRLPKSGGPATPVTVNADVELGIANEHVGDVRHNVVGRAIVARAPFWLPISMTANAESLLRQNFPVGQDGPPGAQTGSALSCAT